MILFLKTAVRIRLNVHIRTIVVLICGKLTRIYFLSYLLQFTSVTTHRRKGKKVNIISSGDVNPGPVLSRQGLLEDSLCRVVGVARLSCD
jgi:hypothetical protein